MIGYSVLTVAFALCSPYSTPPLGKSMASVFDVAKYILKKQGSITHMKLQKLVYYSQAWSLVWDDKPLFNQPIRAWANGPVAPKLYGALRGRFTVTEADVEQESKEQLTVEETGTIDAVLNEYGDKPTQWLSDLTHMEKPWQQARKGLGPGDHGSQEITHASMAEYYGSL